MDKDAYIKLLERRVHNQRVRLRELEGFKYQQLRSIWARLYFDWRRKNRALYARIGAAHKPAPVSSGPVSDAAGYDAGQEK